MLASQVVYVLARARTRVALVSIGAVALLGTPFWYSDLVLAGRFDVGVGSGGKKLNGPWAVLDYLFRVAGDFTTGYTLAIVGVLLVAAVGARVLWFANRNAAVLTACVIGVPVAAFLLARFGESTSPESRHLIFVLPFFAVLVALGLIRLTRRRLPILVAAVIVLAGAEVAWGWDKTAPLYKGEPAVRVAARKEASEWLAQKARKDDVLFWLRAALPRRVGAGPRGLLGHGRAPSRPEARARLAARGAVTRTRRLGLRRERHEQLHAEADDPASLPEPPGAFPGARLRAVPRHPQQAADADAERVPESRRDRPRFSAGRSAPATRT